MRRTVLLLTILVVTLVSASGVAWAILNGTLDGDPPGPVTYDLAYDHPYVGHVDGICSGTLISDRVFLTSAHCASIEDDYTAQVKFYRTSSDRTTATSYQGTFHADPGWFNPPKGERYDQHDIAVVTFTTPISPPGVDISKLPRVPPGERWLDSRAKTTKQFTAVGYGDTDDRRYATTVFQSINGTYLTLTQNANNKKGSAGQTCYGDSGGPNFIGAPPGTNYDAQNNIANDGRKIIASTTNTGDTTCGSTNTTFRLDTRPARQFLANYTSQGVALQ